MTGETAGETLKRLRRGVGMKQRELALLSGLRQGTISRIECGRVVPYRRTLWRLADALEFAGCSDAWDLTGGDRFPRGNLLIISHRLPAHSPPVRGRRG